jgi:uncharacterized protein YdeI (YjbR/CyaY-like superfamily)
MGKRDRRVDAYITRSADFAQPILAYLRAVVHEGCPDADEAIKWGMPFFVRGGALFCFMASFKQHAAFGFRGGERLVGAGIVTEKAMGQFGRLTGLADLPPRKTLLRYVKRAAALGEPGAKPAPRTKIAKVNTIAVPADLRAALAKSAKARKTFEAFPPSHRREYVGWITGAKRDETRQRRLATAIAWMAEGKSQNWRYEK